MVVDCLSQTVFDCGVWNQIQQLGSELLLTIQNSPHQPCQCNQSFVCTAVQSLVSFCRAQRVCTQKMTVVDDNGATVSRSPTEFCTPKFWLMRLWPHTIKMFGSANLTSTGYGERSHVAMKEAFQYTTDTAEKPLTLRHDGHSLSQF